MCKQRCSRWFIACGISLAVVSAGYSQTPPAPSEADQKAQQARVEKSAQSLRQMLGNRLTDDLFLNDKRLNIKITLPPKRYSGSVLLNKLHLATRRWVGSEDVEPVQSTLFVACDDVPSRAVMEAWAMLHSNRWRRADPSAYHLLAPFGEEAFSFMPQSEFEAEVFALGEEFFQSIDKLPPDLKTRLLPLSGTAQGSSEKYTPVGDLPSNVQQLLQRMIAATDRGYEAAQKGNGGTPSPPAPTEQMNDWSIQIARQAGTAFQGYFLTLRHPECVTGFRVNLPQPSIGATSRDPQQARATDAAADTYVPPSTDKAKSLAAPLAKQVVKINAAGRVFVGRLTDVEHEL